MFFNYEYIHHHVYCFRDFVSINSFIQVI